MALLHAHGLRLISSCYSTDMRRLTTGYVLRNASLGDFVVVRRCTYTNLDSTDFYKLPALNLHTVLLFTEGDDTRDCGDTFCPPEDEQRAVRNMLRIVV